MSFADFLIHAKDKAQCPTCKKPFDLLEQVKDPESGDLIIKIECHGETHHEVVSKLELDELEKRRVKALDNINKAAEVLKKPKRRIVNVDPSMYHFSKFRKLR